MAQRKNTVLQLPSLTFLEYRARLQCIQRSHKFRGVHSAASTTAAMGSHGEPWEIDGSGACLNQDLTKGDRQLLSRVHSRPMILGF